MDGCRDRPVSDPDRADPSIAHHILHTPVPRFRYPEYATILRRPMPSYLVTGTSRGLGFGLVRALSDDSTNIVFALARNVAAATDLQELATKRDNLQIVEADITDHHALKSAAKFVGERTGGKLDALINNAGILQHERSYTLLSGYPDGQEDLLADDLMFFFKGNVIAIIQTINAFLPLILAGDMKKVMTITSGLGTVEHTLKFEIGPHGPYSISKAAVNLAIAKYSVQYRKQGVAFLSVSPGLVNTGQIKMGPDAPPEEDKRWRAVMTKLKEADSRFTGPLTIEESVAKQLYVLNKATVDDAGKTLDVYNF